MMMMTSTMTTQSQFNTGQELRTTIVDSEEKRKEGSETQDAKTEMERPTPQERNTRINYSESEFLMTVK